MDPRIGNLFLNAGPGYGGSCLPKDVKAIIDFSRQRGVDSPLLDAVESVNKEQLLNIIEIIRKKLGTVKGKTITVFGLAFKPDTDDVRDSVSIKMIELLVKNRVRVVVHDPKAIKNTRMIFGPQIKYAKSISEALVGSHCAIIMTSWKQYANLSYKDFKIMKQNLIIDTRRILGHKNLQADYHALGIGKNDNKESS